jgi:hypothetical protein
MQERSMSNLKLNNPSVAKLKPQNINSQKNLHLDFSETSKSPYGANIMARNMLLHNEENTSQMHKSKLGQKILMMNINFANQANS